MTGLLRPAAGVAGSAAGVAPAAARVREAGTREASARPDGCPLPAAGRGARVVRAADAPAV